MGLPKESGENLSGRHGCTAATSRGNAGRRDPSQENLYQPAPLTAHNAASCGPASPPTPSFQHVLGLIDSRGTWTLAKESSEPFPGLPWDGKMGGWKRGLPGPVEKGRRGLAEVLLGIRGEVAAPGKKLEETGFTRPEVALASSRS